MLDEVGVTAARRRPAQSKRGLERRAPIAHTLVQLNRPADALAALGDDQSRGADRVRADAYWKTKSWPDAVRVFERLVDVPKDGEKFSQKDAQIVLNWAAALTLSGDQTGLEKLRGRFGAAMAQTPYAAGFRLIASDDADATSDNPRDSARQAMPCRSACQLKKISAKRLR